LQSLASLLDEYPRSRSGVQLRFVPKGFADPRRVGLDPGLFGTHLLLPPK
jgi:hypothetical protein